MHVVTREEMQAIDRYTIRQIGLGGPLLMENAGEAMYRELLPYLKQEEHVAVVIGKGNNGGDGFVLARRLLDDPVRVDVWLLPDPEQIEGDAAYHMRAFLASGGSVNAIGGDPDGFADNLSSADWIVDALLGTGFHGIPRPDYARVIDAVNHAPAKVVSVDLPSGIPADGGPFAHQAVSADLTLTLHCPKLAQFVRPAARFFGEVRTVAIGIPNAAARHVGVFRSLRTEADVRRTLPRRDPFAHKGDFGKGLLIAGSAGMPGAAFFAAKAALRSGIGLLRLSIPDKVRPVLAAELPETMLVARGETDLNSYDGIAVGPGLGRDPQRTESVRAVVLADIPCVIDADGLFHLSPMKDLLKKRKSPTVLSPHPGEMARLAGTTIAQVENDRFGTARAFAEEYGVYLVLKGKYTIITAPDGRQAVNPTGNAALAKGGSGDVLSGILLAFLLQHRDPMDAVCNAVYLHGALADTLVTENHSMMDVLATDLIEEIPPVLHRLCKPATC